MKKLILSLILSTIFTGIIYAADLTVESQTQHYKDAEHKIELTGDVNVKYEDINASSPKAEVIINADSGKVEKAKFFENAYSYQIKDDKKHEVKAKILEISLLNKLFKADERTQSTVLSKQEPILIVTADSQEYDNKSNVMKAKGSVIIYYEDSQAFADYAQVDLDKNNELQKLTLTGNANIKKENSTVTANKFVHYADTKITTASGSVFSDINDESAQIKVWSDFQQIDQNSNILTASGHTVVHYQDYVAQGPKASVFPDPKTNKLNKVVFLGRSKITQQGRTIEADRIDMTMEPKDFRANGNVKTFIPNVDGKEAL